MRENKAVQKGTPALRVLRQGQAAASSIDMKGPKHILRRWTQYTDKC